MKKNLWIMIFSIGFFSCSKKMYVKDDYTFYKPNFHLSDNSKLRTDGVYVLENIWTKDSERKPTEHIFYKFYETGQSNLTVDLNHEINSKEEYISSIKNQINSTNKTDFTTHFEGYYNLKENKIIIQSVNVPRNLFNYNYGFIQDGELIIVKETISGKGKFEDKFFTDYYKATYKFLPLDKKQLENLQPGW